MTNNAIKVTIDNINTNREIKWSIVTNTDSLIVLTNSYDKCVKYTIKVRNDDGEEWIIVKDNHMNKTVDLLCKGYNAWDDYSLRDQGLARGIELAVLNFNSTY